MAVSLASDFSDGIVLKITFLLKERGCSGEAAASEVLIGEVGDFAATRGALYEAFLDEIRLIHFLESARVFAKGSGDGG